MNITVADAQTRLAELVRRAEAGEEVLLTLEGHDPVKLVKIQSKSSPKGADLTPGERLAIIERIQEKVRLKGFAGPSSKELQDSLYDEFGLPV